MKKLLTKAIGVALSLMLAASCLAPATVQAAEIYAPKEQTVYLNSKNGYTYSSFQVSGLTKSQKIKLSTVKSTNTKVGSIYSLDKNAYSYEYETEYAEASLKEYNTKYSSTEYYYLVGVQLKKAGKTTVSYKIGNKKYNTVLNVKNYTNPLKTVTITGINSNKNIASKLKNQNTAYLTLKKNTNDVNLKLATNSGWKITSVDVYFSNDDSNSSYTDEQISFNSRTTGRSSLKLNIGDLKKKDAYDIHIYLVNTKTGGTMSCHYYINNK